MPILTNGQRIDKYIAQNLIKANPYTETYRVVDDDDNPYFLKVFLPKKMPAKLINPDTGMVYEIEYSQNLKHKNLISFIDKGNIDTEEGTAQYYVTNYFTGELLADKIYREGPLPEEEALSIYRAILEGLQYMHSQELFHNDITPRNIMLSTVESIEHQIIDMGHVSKKCTGKVSFDVSDLELKYCANETFGGLYDEQTDLFSATAVLYAMLTGKKPWDIELSPTASRTRNAITLKEFRKENKLDFDSLNIDKRTRAVLEAGLCVDYHDRPRSIADLMRKLDPQAQTPDTPREETRRPSSESSNSSNSNRDRNNSDDPNKTDFVIKRGGGNGFVDIAGMNELKEYLKQKIIFVIKNKELASKYKISAPNAMLLYGPPGCGKTFIAEKFAEETDFNYILIKSSDLASSFVHGGQQKIAALFKEAEKNAPVVICFDEFDALVPDRSLTATQYVAGEVNEFLSQLNNCSKRGIFVVATTNRPDKIDSAVMRTGRIDKQVYVPLPDKEARREMFLLHLKDRPFDENEIQSEKLAEMTDGYIASDIAFIVNDAAMVAAFTGQLITEEMLEDSIRNTRPSLSKDVLTQYEDMRVAMEGAERRNLTRRPVGFKTQEE